MSQNSAFSDVDVVNIFLGRNNGFNTSILEQLDDMIASIKEYNSDIIVTIMGAYNVACDSSGTGQYLQSAGDFNFTAHRFNKAFYERYKSSEDVNIIPAHCNLDNKYDYTTKEVPISDIDDRTITVYTDNVHPDERGYKKLAVVINAYFKHLLS
jgi:lysophospholipase L1-like esterase